MKKVRVDHYQDNGRECVSVSLKNHDSPAILYQEDFNRLIEAGINPEWKLWKGQVATVGKKPLLIMRLVAEVAKGVWVRPIDGNSCNLRRSNLVIGRKQQAPITHNYSNPYYMKEIIDGLTR